MIDEKKIFKIVEATLLVANEPLEVKELVGLFTAEELEGVEASKLIRQALEYIEKDCAGRSLELKRVASGYRFQVKQEYSEWVGRMLKERPPRYTRALLETLAIVVYKQPVTRGDIEDLRGVSVSQNIIRTLLERSWIKVVGQKEVPGRPSLYATTKEFLDYFNLKSLNELPEISEIQELMLKEINSSEVVEDLADFELSPAMELRDDFQNAKAAGGEGVAKEADSSNVITLPINN